jgi:hypothetical protein
MIIVKIICGLGNQLFQYAAARSVADVRNTPLRLEISHDETYKQRKYELCHYRIKAPIATRADLAACHLVRPPRPLRVLFRLRILKEPQARIYYEKNWSFNQGVFELPLPVLLVGFFQSYRYFERIRETLLDELTPVNEPSGENCATLDQILQTDAVAVHVRRGDYVADPGTNAKHGTSSLEYYKEAFAHVRERVASPHLYIFSDDPTWTRENLRFDAPCTYVTHNGPHTAYEDIRLMSHCRHAIIANSSFSWWGAWLNRNPDKIVIAPAQWWAVPDEISICGTTKDLCPPEWVRL